MRFIFRARGVTVFDLELAWPFGQDNEAGPALRSGGTHLAHTEIPWQGEQPFGFVARTNHDHA